MGFTELEIDISQVGKLLSHPARVRLLTALLEQDKLTSGELTGLIPQARTTVLQHITTLKNDGWLLTETDGSNILYRINQNKMGTLKGLLNPLLGSIEKYKMRSRNTINILFLCTGNSCRSQMAEAFINNQSDKYHVKAFSAGTIPGKEVKPLAIEVMDERGIDMRDQYPKSTKEFVGDDSIDIVIFVCDRAERECPYYFPFSKQKIFMPFKDPETPEEFREVRDQIEAKLNILLEEIP